MGAKKGKKEIISRTFANSISIISLISQIFKMAVDRQTFGSKSFLLSQSVSIGSILEFQSIAG